MHGNRILSKMEMIRFEIPTISRLIPSSQHESKFWLLETFPKWTNDNYPLTPHYLELHATACMRLNSPWRSSCTAYIVFGPKKNAEIPKPAIRA